MFIAAQLFQSNTASLLNPSTTVMRLPAPAAAQLLAIIGASGNFTTLSLSNGVVSEIVYATGVSGVNVTIQRAQEGSTAQTFTAGTVVRFVWTEVSIQDVAAGGSAGITITGGGATTVTGGPFAFNVSTPAGALVAGTGISVTGSWPNITITNTAPGGGGGPTIVTGSGQAAVTAISGGYNVDVPTPVFTAGTGIGITGTYPHLTITNTDPGAGATGTVLDVTAGTGIAVTGTPTTHPIVSISPTGVAAGTYGALTVNAQGQLTNITGALVSSIAVASTPALTASAPSGGVVTLAIADSSTSVKGLIARAVNTSAASSNAADNATCVTPSGVAAVLAAQVPVTVSADTTNIPLASASYTNAILTSSLALNLLAGKTAIVTCVLEVADPGDATLIPNFGIGLFTGATFIDGNSDNVPGAVRTLVVKIVGPFTGVVRMASTALTGSFAAQSKSINIVTN